MIDLGISIMAHPTRQKHVLQYMKPRLSSPKIRFNINWDYNSRGSWWNAKECWRMARGTHHMVIQDDAILADDFVEGVLLALEANPDVPVCWYGNDSVLDRAAKAGHNWAILRNGIWGICFSMPSPMVVDFLHWESTMNVFANAIMDDVWKTLDDDTRITLYLHEKDIDTWMSVPCLIQHGGRGKSLLKHNTPNSYSNYYTGESAIKDWSLPDVPYRGTASFNQRGFNSYTSIKGYQYELKHRV